MSHFKKHAMDVLARGFSCIPIIPGDKRPGYKSGDQVTNLDGWQKYCTAQPSDEAVAEWSKCEASLGLPCGNFVVAVDIDVLDPGLAHEVEKKVLEIAGVDEAPVRTGKFPKRAIFFRPEGHIQSRSKKWKDEAGTSHGLDILGSGRQVVAFGTHPDTGREYVWRGGDPCTVHRDALPALTPDMVVRILDYLVELGAKADGPEDVHAVTRPARQQQAGEQQPHAPIDPLAIRWIAQNLPNGASVTWDDWIRIGYSFLEASRPDTNIGFECWLYWSAKNEKHSERECARKWLQMETDSRGTVGFGTLIKECQAENIVVPPEIEFSKVDTSNIDLRNYVDKIARLEVGGSGLSDREYFIYLFYVYSGPDNIHEGGILGLFNERCPGAEAPEEIGADEIEAVRAKVVAQMGEIGREDPRKVPILFRSGTTTATLKAFVLAKLDEEAPRDTDHVVSSRGLHVRMRPLELPSTPAAARFRVPGVISEFAQWVDETSPAIVPEFGITAGLSLVATLVGRAVKTATGLRPNIYAINLARSGTGKNHALSRLRKTLSATGLLDQHSFGSMAFSGSAVRNAFSRASGGRTEEDEPDGTSMSKIWTSDEFSSVWSVNSSGGNHGAAMMGDLLSFFSGSDEIMAGTVLADRSAPAIPYPHLTILGASTPDAMFEAMTVEQMRAGHANRFLLMEPGDIKLRSWSDKIVKWSGTKAHLDVPDDVKKTVLALCRWVRERQGFANSMWTDYAHVVPMEQAAIEEMARIETLKEECNAYAEANPDVASEPFSRIDEMTGRVALLVAMSRLAEKLTQDQTGWKVVSMPEIIEADVKWAFELVRYSAERVAYAIGSSERASSAAEIKRAGDREAAHIERVLRVVKGAGESGIARADILRSTRLPAPRLDIVLRTLNDSRDIIGIPISTKTKVKTVYFTADHARAAISSDRVALTTETTWN